MQRMGLAPRLIAPSNIDMPRTLRPQLPEDEALAELLALDQQERIDQVEADVQNKSDRYAGIGGHELGEALGLFDCWAPGGDWARWAWTPPMTLEEDALAGEPFDSDFAERLKGVSSPARIEEISRQVELVSDTGELDYSFLEANERAALESERCRERLERDMGNGLGYYANQSVKASSGAELDFEATLEDDGSCLEIKTPYDQRDGRFLDTSDGELEWW
jgi:hypothetical protein